MPRSVYHQSAGNPVQLDRLPASKPELHFAAKALSFSEQTMTIGKCWGLLLLGTACVWSMQPDGVFRSELGLMAVVLFLGANFLMLEETTTANPNWMKALSVLYTFGFFVVAGFAVSVAHPLLAAVGLGAFVWLFGMHAVDLATTAPMPMAEATQHRKGAASYFAVMALVPAALSLLPMPHRAVGVVAMAVVAVMSALLDEGGSSFGCLLTSWRDWLTYNRYGSQAPGLRETIAGSWRIRFALLSGCLLLLVACGVKHSTEPLPLTPLGLVLFAPPLLAWPALMRVRASQKATTPDNRWSRLVGSLQESTDQIERESVYFGQVVSDGSPVIV